MIMDRGNGSDSASLEYSFKYNPPMDHSIAARNLKTAKEILDHCGVVFMLFSGACLGAIRDGAFILWDDDIDLLSIMGLNSLTEDQLYNAVNLFRESGFFIKEVNGSYSRAFSMIKDHVRIGCDADYIVGDTLKVYPGISMPARLFRNPEHIEFLGEDFLVPSPPEEYLSLKYGSTWTIPKRAGEYERDVVERIPDATLVGHPAYIRILDHDGKIVVGGEVSVVGGNRATTDTHGYAEVILPGLDFYALTISYPGHQKVLYMEEIQPQRRYVYRPSIPDLPMDQFGTLGNVLEDEQP